jgi:hypothetical protein
LLNPCCTSLFDEVAAQVEPAFWLALSEQIAASR